MAMLNSIVKGGFYPYPPEQLSAARSLFAPAPQEGGRCVLRALDPCAGEGAALAYLAANLGLEPYANELDANRAGRCQALFGQEHTVAGDLFRLRASNEAFALVWCNPPYGENYGGDDRRIELSALRHSWKWAMVGGYVAWVVYAHHMTHKAAEFLAANADQVDVYRLPGLHLGQYAQILVVARKIERRDPDPDLAGQLVESCRCPHSLPELARLDAPRYRFPAPPEVRRFVFAPDEITADVMLAAMQEHGAQQLAGFRQLLTPLPPPPGFHPIVQPRGGHLGLVLAGGLLDGALVKTDEGSAAVRGVVRLVTVDTTPEGQHGIRETYQTRPQVTVSLLWKDGRTRTIEAEKALVDFLKAHKSRLLAHLEERSKP
ncbi:MAG: hypothetical protein JXB07_03520, partial [Anaerolineae bacterium]|nr:hypothetical protein [Anaerolineae bacterium]